LCVKIKLSFHAQYCAHETPPDPPLGVTINRTGRHRTALGPYRAGNDWLFHFNDCYE